MEIAFFIWAACLRKAASAKAGERPPNKKLSVKGDQGFSALSCSRTLPKIYSRFLRTGVGSTF